MSIASVVDQSLQWLGFVFLIAGAWVYRKPMQLSSMYLIGSAFLLAWCILQDVIPWGVAAVQIVSVVAWSVNIGKELNKRESSK